MHFFYFFQILGLVTIDGATVGPMTCTNSGACGSGMCCRATDGRVLSDMPNQFPFFANPGSTQLTGTCSSTKAQKGEVCDSSCQCDTGLACYRPMSGVCCPPQTCYDEAYVHQQQAYWQNCYKDPNCAIPP